MVMPHSPLVLGGFGFGVRFRPPTEKAKSHDVYTRQAIRQSDPGKPHGTVELYDSDASRNDYCPKEEEPPSESDLLAIWAGRLS
jgi:hypothetical protein